MSHSALADSTADKLEQAGLHKQQGDYAKAYCLWKELADSDNADALYNLGWMYHNGYGLAIDDQQALRYWSRAAEQQHADALMSLGNLYRLGGKGVDKSRTRAIDYFLQAARNGIDDAGDLIRILLHQADASLEDYRRNILQQHTELLGGQLEVTGKRSNYRQKASAKSKILRVLTPEDRLIELGRKGDWVHAATQDGALAGWIHKSLVKAAGD